MNGSTISRATGRTVSDCTSAGRRRRGGSHARHQAGGDDRVRQIRSLHTLGPAGTNCELAARRWFARAGRPGRVVLYRTLEEAAAGALATVGGALLAPAAYPDLHTLVYSHIADLAVADTIVLPTHAMVLARRPESDALATVASHPAPMTLVPAGLTVRLVASNAQAAADCAAGTVDACITTSPAMEQHGLELVHDYGPVPMAFTIHVRKAAAGEEADNYDR